jgi:magnesium transporter
MCYNWGMISYFYRAPHDTSLQTLPKPGKDTWVHAESPTSEELDLLAADLALDRDLLRDAVDFYEVPRFESEDGTAYFFTRFPHQSETEVGTSPILITVGPTAVLTVSLDHPACFDRYLTGTAPLVTTERAKLFLKLMGAINVTYRTNLITIGRDVQRNRVNFGKIKNRDIVRLVGFESTLNNFISALVPTYAALRTILSGSNLPLKEEDRDNMEDIQLENQQIVESAKANLKNIQNIRSAYTAIVTNNLNSVIKLLTSITIILTIPMIITSVYGMNVPLPWSGSPHVFSGIIVAIVLAMAAVAYVFNRQDWL